MLPEDREGRGVEEAVGEVEGEVSNKVVIGASSPRELYLRLVISPHYLQERTP